MLHRRCSSHGSRLRALGPLPLALLSFSTAALWAASCGRAHTLGISGGTGGEGGGGGGSSAATDGASASSSASGSSDAGVIDAGPPGPTRLTIVNGVNDYDAIRLCFLPYPDGDPTLKPWPSAPEGLAFAGAVVVDPIDATVPPGKDIRPVVFAGDLAKIADRTCEEALVLAAAGGGDADGGGGGTGGGGSGGAGGGAGGGDAGSSPPPLIAASLAVLPAQVFDSHQSILLVPAGCLGGPGHDGSKAVLACGFGYTPSAPNVSLVALGMARKTDATHLSFQVVNASPALQPTDVRVRAGFDAAKEWPVASALAFGTIGPAPPFNMFTLKDLGPLDKATVKTYPPGQSFQSSSMPLTESLMQGTVPKEKLVNGGGFVLVGVGAYPGIEAGPFWHKLTFTLIKANP